MLPEINKIGGITTFSLPEKYNTGWRIEVKRDGIIVKTGYASTKEDIDILRGKWISLFWGRSLN